MVEESWDKPIDWYTTNFLSNVKMLEKIKKFKFIKNLLILQLRGLWKYRQLVKRSFSFNPSTPYALSRAATDFHLKLIFKVDKFPVVFTRTANVYGPHSTII